jgi:hypothetical protein
MARKAPLPLRPKRPADEQIPEPLRTPAPPTYTPTRDNINTSHGSGLASPFTTPVAATEQPAPAAFSPPINGSSTNPTAAITWPSEVSQRSSTMWLLPAYTDQSSTIAQVLRAEIQAHNISKEMLHATEHRRLESIRRCEQLEIDVRNWGIAYGNSSTALRNCAEEYAKVCAEYSRICAENTTLKAQGLNGQVQTISVSVLSSLIRVQTLFQNPPHGSPNVSKERQSRMFHQKKVPQFRGSPLESICESENDGPDTWDNEEEDEYSPSFLSPEV